MRHTPTQNFEENQNWISLCNEVRLIAYRSNYINKVNNNQSLSAPTTDNPQFPMDLNMSQEKTSDLGLVRAFWLMCFYSNNYFSAPLQLDPHKLPLSTYSLHLHNNIISPCDLTEGISQFCNTYNSAILCNPLGCSLPMHSCLHATRKLILFARCTAPCTSYKTL